MSINLNFLQNKKIALLGLGLENLALLSYLTKNKISAVITICDARSSEELGSRISELQKNSQIKWQLGKSFNKNLDKFDILLRSPGWPIFCPGIQEALRAGTILSSPMNLFFMLAPTKNIIGVTGTKGKGTTSSLIYQILHDAKRAVFLGGNIGTAPFSFLEKLSAKSWVVLELSSFQLEDLQFSPHIAVITNIYPEHLKPADPLNPNFHANLKLYIKAKKNIASHQTANDYLVINKKLKLKAGQGRRLIFTKSTSPSNLAGNYNQENVAAAEMVAKILKINSKLTKKAIKNFKGLEHRLEKVITKQDRTFYDNSFATTPESTILDLESFKSPIILLAGGADKGADFKNLAKAIKNKVKFLILLKGSGTIRLKKDLLKINFPKNKLAEVASMELAVKTAKKNSAPGDIILLSTGCASFGMFKNYKERGNLFKKYAQAQ